MKESYLVHYGVLGMKWGVRRYQNPDGSLTEAGKKRYDNNDKQLYKDLRKQIRSKRSELHGWSNQFAKDLPIGKKSEKTITDAWNKEKEYRKTDAYKKWVKKIEAYEKKYEDKPVVDIDEYEKGYEKIMASQPKKNFKSPVTGVIYDGGSSENGGPNYSFINNFINEYGRDVSISYLEDLNYSNESAKYFVDRLAKSGYSLGW